MTETPLFTPIIASTPTASDGGAIVSDHARQIAATYQDRTSLDFCVMEWETGTITGSSSRDLLRRVPASQINRLKTPGATNVVRTSDGLFLFAAPIPGELDGRIAAIGCAVAEEDLVVERWEGVALDAGWTMPQFRSWLSRHTQFSQRALERILRLAADGLRQELSLRRSADEADFLANQVNGLLGEITFLHDLTAQLKMSVAPLDLANKGVQQLGRTIGAGGVGVWLQDGLPEPAWVTSGELPLDPATLPALLAEFDRHDWKRPLVRNGREGRPASTTVPEIRNLVVAPLKCTGRIGGWLLAVNAVKGGSFGTVEGSLTTSVASVLATHMQNVSLFRENDELIVSFVRSLVSTIDAKDAYTRGHSVRVAAVAKFLTRQLGLNEEQAEAIHLSGLLHDIGKIGVDDAILRKPGRLTTEEFDQIKRHPVIGCQILSGLKNLEHVLPGVLHHHENYDGSGYPDGLSSTDIPRMARILSVADAFDAMRSDRPYRAGLTTEQVISILDAGVGRQWDPVIVRALTSSRLEVESVWQSAHADPATAELIPVEAG